MIATHLALAYRFAIGGDEGGRALLARVLAPLAVDETGTEIRYEDVYRLHVDGARAVARRGDMPVYEGSIGAATSHLMTTINTGAIGSMSMYPVVHAAVVARAGAAIVIPGNPGAGKSTLCAALVAHGYEYVSDEMALIFDDGRVPVYPKPIVVGAGSFEVLACLRDADGAGGMLDTWFLDARRLAGGVSAEAPLLRAVVMPEYRPGTRVEAAGLSPGEVTALLASNMFNLRQLGRSALDRVAVLSPRLQGVRVVHSDAHDAITVIDELRLT